MYANANPPHYVDPTGLTGIRCIIRMHYGDLKLDELSATNDDFKNSSKKLQELYTIAGEYSTEQVVAPKGNVTQLSKAIERLKEYVNNQSKTKDQCCESVDILGHGNDRGLWVPDATNGFRVLGPKAEAKELAQFIKDLKGVLCDKCATEGDVQVRVHACFSGAICGDIASQLQKSVLGYVGVVGFANKTIDPPAYFAPRGTKEKPPMIYSKDGGEPKKADEKTFKHFYPPE